MTKVKYMYSTQEEKDKLIKVLKTMYKVVKVSKEYKEGPHRRIYVDITNK